MNRIDKKFKFLKKNNHKALITFITAGDPDINTTIKLAGVLEKAGADMIELGVPFSDPLADGATIQAASARALEKGITLPKIIKAAGIIRKNSDVPLILMTYVNPVHRFGYGDFFEECRQHGLDGVIIPDLVPEEAGIIKKHAGKNGVHLIFLAAPTSPDSRLKMICRRTGGFLYYVCLTGTTGAREGIDRGLMKKIKKVKRFSKVPVACGFGISTPAQVKEICRHADGAIVGSALVNIIERYGRRSNRVYKEVYKFVAKLRIWA